MSITLSNIIYAIIRGEDGKLFLKTFPLTLEREPSDAELREHFNYSVSLSDQYSSDLCFLPPQNSFILNLTRKYRREAFSFQETSAKIQSEYDVVAISHRRGGWKTFTWNYNDDISFEIFSNFGYGSCSELVSRFFYKGIQLTPYSDYIHYRYANYSQLVRYTHSYNLEYSEWRKLMNDTLVFYNAVCNNQEHEIFRWLRSQLNQMMNGLEKILTQSSYYFTRPNNSSECVSGDDLEAIKAEKIAGAIEFVDNIKSLPHQIKPQEYLNSLVSILDRYYSHAIDEELVLKTYIQNLEQQVNQMSSLSILSIYDRLHKRHYYKDNWHLNSKKIEMIRYLINLHNRLKRPFLKEEIKTGITQLQDILKERDKIRKELFGKKELFESIQNAIEKINNFKEAQQVKY